VSLRTPDSVPVLFAGCAESGNPGWPGGVQQSQDLVGVARFLGASNRQGAAAAFSSSSTVESLE
jgi:hypothetical protein